MPKKTNAVKKVPKLSPQAVFHEQVKVLLKQNSAEKAIETFVKERDHLHAEIANFSKVVKDTPLLASFLIWVKEYKKNSLAEDYPNLLLENKWIAFKNRSGNLIKIKDLAEKEIRLAIEEIRCQRELSLEERELLVENLIDFFNWLANQTLFYHLKVEDPDKLKVKDRLFDYEDFIMLLTHLDERCRLIAKLLYFGGRRTLEEVTTLQIESIDFKNHFIEFTNETISYPLHVFEDTKNVIGARSSGKVFIGRKNAPINPSTIFRNFNEVAALLKFRNSFSPKSLTSDL